MTRYTEDRIDESTLADLCDTYSGVGPFKFAFPPECIEGKGGTDKDTPGVYLRAWGSSSGGPHPYGVQRPLTPTQAREIAVALDQHDPIKFCCDGQDMGDWPHSYVEIIDRFYAALGRRLERSITASTGRASRLREVRAALTGEVSDQKDPNA